MNLAEVWERLEEDTRTAGVSGRVQRRIVPAGRRDFFLGLDMPSRNRMLILRVAAGSVEGQPDVEDSRGLTVRTAPRNLDGERTEVELVLTESQHLDIFDLLIRDLVDAAEEPQDERTGLTRFFSRLSDWQQLLRRLAPRGLSREAQQGLWGELWVLIEIVAPVMGMAEAVRAWRGPLGSDQDFQMMNTSIEVKTSTAHVLDRLPIASERQLEAPDDVTLVLVGLSLDSRVGYGDTLPSMVGISRTVASEAGCLRLLDNRLELYGYEANDESMYSDVGFSLRSFRAFLVEDGFPRIISRDLPSGIGDVRYSVSTASCSPFLVNLENASDLLRGLV